MPPIHMTRDQRSALTRLSKSPLPLNELSSDHAEKLVSHGLAVRDTFRFWITQKGQLELLRQRFRNVKTRTTLS